MDFHQQEDGELVLTALLCLTDNINIKEVILFPAMKPDVTAVSGLHHTAPTTTSVEEPAPAPGE